MNDFELFHSYVKDIALSPIFQKMDEFVQHGDISTMEHVICVSFYSFLQAKKRGLDCKTTARGAMMHDLYLYDWHIKDLASRPPLTHGFTHPALAEKNAKKFFNADENECKIIRNHMWPLTIFHIPPTKEAMIVSLTDKYCASRETLGKYDSSKIRKEIKKYMNYIKLNKESL